MRIGMSDLVVKPIGVGTWQGGDSRYWEFGVDYDAHDLARAFDMALDMGISLFDTAEIYAVPTKKETYGLTEKYIGNWFAKTKKRDKIILATKIASKADDVTWIREGGNNLNFNIKNMTEAIELQQTLLSLPFEI